MASLLLLRHGQIRANRDGRWHGSTDSPLTWRGRRQAGRTARYLAARHQPVAAIYASPLERCLHTARLAGQRLGLEPVTVPGLREYGIGEWEDTSFNELAADYGFFSRIADDPHFKPPGGESLTQVAERTVSALEEIDAAHEAEARVLVVGHGAGLAAALGSLLSGHPNRWVEYPLANCSLTELMLSPTPYVNFFNSTEHL